MSRRVAVIESELFIVCAPRSPESVNDVGCASTVTFAEAPAPACVASPAKLAVSRCTPGLRAARNCTVTRPSVPVVTGIPAPPRPTRTLSPDERARAHGQPRGHRESVSVLDRANGRHGLESESGSGRRRQVRIGRTGNRPRPVERADVVVERHPPDAVHGLDEEVHGGRVQDAAERARPERRVVSDPARGRSTAQVPVFPAAGRDRPRHPDAPGCRRRARRRRAP